MTFHFCRYSTMKKKRNSPACANIPEQNVINVSRVRKLHVKLSDKKLSGLAISRPVKEKYR